VQRNQYSNTSDSVAIFISHCHSAVPSPFCSRSKRRDYTTKPSPSSPQPVHGVPNSTLQKYPWLRKAPAHGYNSLANLTYRYLSIPLKTSHTFCGSTTLLPHATNAIFLSSMFCEPLIARVPGVSDVACSGCHSYISYSYSCPYCPSSYCYITPNIYPPTPPQVGERVDLPPVRSPGRACVPTVIVI
jgi:hypothetical protein